MAKRRASGEGSLFQRKDGMWVGSYEIPTYDGKRRQKRVYAAKHADARRKLRELRDLVDDGYIPSASTSMATWLKYWLEEIKRPQVKPKTFEYYEESVRLHIMPAIGTKRLGRLMVEDVRQMLKTVGSSYNRKRAHFVLNLALKAAVSNGYLRRNVCEAVDKPGHLAEEGFAFTADQAKAIIRTGIGIEASRDKGSPAAATLWAASFLSGARPAELLGLEWDRVDLDNGVADFCWQLQQLTKVHGCGEPSEVPPEKFRRPDRPPKGPLFYPCQRQSGSWCPQGHWKFRDDFEYRECYKSLLLTRPKTIAGTRVVPLIPGMVAMLRKHQSIIGPNPHGLVWHHPDGRPISPTNSHAMWQDVMKGTGLTVDDETIPWYSARHSTATMLQEAGVPEEVRMRIMGQSSAAAHQKYIHVDQTQTRAALANLTGLLG